jgi:hypothetical protein
MGVVGRPATFLTLLQDRWHMQHASGDKELMQMSEGREDAVLAIANQN